jgi:uncharacterized protein YjaZ
MKDLKQFIKTTIREFLNENKEDIIYSGQEVWDYFNKLISRHHSKYDDPIHNQHKEQILKNNYILKDILIDDLLKSDVDLKDYVETQMDYYKEKWKNENNKVYTYGLIGNSSFSNDVLIDGYHRLLQKIINGDKTFKVFVPIKSKFN